MKLTDDPKAYAIMGCAMRVHNTLGHGWLGAPPSPRVIERQRETIQGGCQKAAALFVLELATYPSKTITIGATIQQDNMRRPSRTPSLFSSYERLTRIPSAQNRQWHPQVPDVLDSL